ncbi:GntR family transcriptional regulator [Actinopolymorpha alba]|uniref:GntR family transcriptional regulator n=1 Tax=Actinopolymorpha alba TaxID=533267 RepID=UPI0003823F96|nr:GntR family transcriptional regulator [Actinopolymorpha alba]
MTLSGLGERPNLREQITEALRAALITGEMEPGMIYSAPALAQKFGVSATPVREAMLELAKGGLVEMVRNKGFRVTELSERDLDEITEVRSYLEVPAVTRLTGRLDAEVLSSLRVLAAEIERAARARDLIAYIEADHRFHLGLLGRAGNTRLLNVVADMRARSRLFGLSTLSDESLNASAREHAQLLDLLAGDDPAVVEALIRRHIGHVRGAWASDSQHG